MSEQKLASKTRTYAIAATTTAKELCKENKKRTGLKIRVANGYTAYILSAQNMPATEGIPIVAATPYDNYETTAPLWVITASGTADVRVQDSTD